jgi:aminodeoxyfutalosine synthase
VRAVHAAGLGTWRFVVHYGALDVRLPLIARVDAVQTATGGVRAFAPLPMFDPPAAPSTGYDDVRTVALARAVCRDVPVIQIDWRQYGPKLAQVAIAFGANDLDNVPAIDDPALGPRRAAREDLARQIRAAGATPQERDGRFQPLPAAIRS